MSESEMVLRVAKAIATADGDDYDKIPYGKSEWVAQRGGEPFRDINQPFRADYDEMARAAIEALKHATPEMYRGWRSVNCTHGEGGLEEFTYFSGDYGNWLACHQAMLSAALSGEEGK